MKKWIALIVMLVAMCMLSGCNLIGYDAQLDGAQVVAKVNDTEITKSDWQMYRNYLAEYEQQYYEQYFGFSFDLTEEDIAAYGEEALNMMIESAVVQDKIAELGLDQLSEEDAAEVEEYATGMVDLYKMMLRYQNYPEIETVEEEAERLAAAAEAGETAEDAQSEPVATVTNEQLDEMLNADLATMGYTYEYFSESQKSSMQSQSIYDYAVADVTVSDDEVKAKFDETVASQKTSYDATPTLYASNEASAYYVPAGYRGVKNLLIKLSDEDSAAIAEIETAIQTAQNLLTDANARLEEYQGVDTAEYDEESLALHNEQIATYEAQATEAQATIDTKNAELTAAQEAAFAAILPTAQEVITKLQAGESFDALLETYGQDTGMTSEPAKTRGYLVCEGLNLYVPEFQAAAMALAQVGDISAEPVKTSYGYHILQYASDIEAGEVEYTDTIKESIHTELLTAAQDAAYEAAITQWVSEAEVKTFPKVME